MSRTWWVVAGLAVAAALAVGESEEHEAANAAAETPVALFDVLGGEATEATVIAFAGAPPCGNEDCASPSAIWMARPDGGEPTQLTRPVGATDRLPRWAPDGSALVFTRIADGSGVGELMVMRSDGRALGAPQPLADRGGLSCEGARLEAVWAPDSSAIAATCAEGGRSSVIVIPAAGGRATPVSRRHALADSRPSWSPDGSVLAFSRRTADARFGRPGRLTIWSATIADGVVQPPRRLVSGALAVDGPAWSPDGRTLAFTERDERTLRTSLSVLDLATGSTRRLWEAPRSSLTMLYDLAWSPDGKRLAVPVGDGLRSSTILLVDTATGTATPISSNGAVAFAPRWSRDAAAIVFDEVLAEQHHLVVYDVEAGSARVIGRLAEEFDATWGVVATTGAPPPRSSGGSSVVPEPAVPGAPTSVAPPVPDVTAPRLPEPTVPVPTLPSIPTTVPPVTTPALPEPDIPPTVAPPVTLPGAPPTLVPGLPAPPASVPAPPAPGAPPTTPVPPLP